MADTEELLVTLGIQDKGASKQINALNRELKYLDKEYKSASKTSKDFESSTEGLKTKLEYLQKKYDTSKAKLEAYKKKMDETTESIKEQEEKISQMKLDGMDTTKAEEQLERMKKSLRNTASEVTICENEIKGLNNQISETNKAIKDNSINDYKSNLKDLGESLEGTGNKISGIAEKTNKISIATSAVIGGLSALALNAQNDLGTLDGRLGVTGEESEKLKQVALSVYSDGFGESLGNCVDDLVILQQNLESTKTWTDETKTSILEQMSTMNELFGTTSEELTRTLAVMQNSGLDDDIQHAMDVLTYGFQNGADYSGELLDTMREYSPQFVKLGLSSEEAMKYLITGAQNGAFNLDKVGDAMKEFSIRVVEGSQTTDDAFALLGMNTDKMMDKFAKGGDSAKGAFSEVLKSLADMKDPLEQNLVGVNLFGTMWEDLGASTVLSLADVSGGLENVNEATLKASESLQNTPAKEFEKTLREVKTQLLPLGTELLKVATVSLPSLTESVKLVTEFLNNLDDSTKENIAKIALLTATLGPSVSIVGKMTSGIGGLFTALSKLSPSISKAEGSVQSLNAISSVAKVNFAGLSSAILPVGIALATVGTAVYTYKQEQEALSKSVVTCKEDLGLLKSTLLELNGVHVQSREELEKSGLVYKQLSDDLGKEFKDKVNESTTAINEFNFELNKTNMDGVLTEEETNEFTNRIDNMCNTALETIKSKQTETQNEMAKTFTLDDGVIDESEQQVLEYLNKNYNTNIEEVTKLKDDVNAIYKKALEDKRGLNEEEIKDIQDKMAKIKQIELEALANNEQEQMFARNEFNNRIKQVDAEGAQELLVQQKKTLDEQNAQTLAAYDTQIDTMKVAKQKALSEEDKANADNLQKQIDAKTKERDALLQKQQETWDGYIDIVEKSNPELVGKINEYNGEILSNADIQAQKGLQYMKEHYDGLEQVTHDGWYKIKNEVDGSIEDCYMTIDENTGKITAVYNKTTGVVGGYTDDMKKKAQELGEQHETERLKINTAMGQIANSHINTKNQIISADGEIIGSLDKVTTSADGVKTGIVNINGTPMQIKTNADGVITDMTTVTDKVKAIPEKKDVTINFFQKGLDWIKQKWDSITNKSVKVDANVGKNATGTYSYTGNGLSTVDEKGWELASNNNVQVLGSYASNTLTSIPTGTEISTHMQSVQDMKYAVSEEVKKAMLNYKNNNPNIQIDYSQMAEANAQALIQILGNIIPNVYVNVDSNGMITKAVDRTMDKINRQSKMKKVSQGR